MNKLDLDISKYSTNELQDVFNIFPAMNNDQIVSHIDNFKSNIAIDNNLNLAEKDNISKFLDTVVKKLCGSLDKIYIEPPSSKIFSSSHNDMINNTAFNHPVIENPNILAGRNSKIHEGKTVNFNDYPPGYINPINVKTIKKVLNIDTRFRSSYYSTLSSDFHLDLPETFKRVVNLQLSAFELPLTAYAVNCHNNTFTIDTTSNIDISYGNYTTPFTARQFGDVSANITTAINKSLDNSGLSNDISYSIDVVSGKSNLISSATGAHHTIYFNKDNSGDLDLDNPLPLKLGWLLGFRTGKYDIKPGDILTSEGIVTIAAPKYLYICINDFTNAGNNSFIAAFNESTLSPHIIARVQYQDLIQHDGIFNFGMDDNTLKATREYFGPVDIQKLQLQILDEYGRVIDFNNMDWSCTLTFDILYD